MSTEQAQFANAPLTTRLQNLFEQTGSHSPSPVTLREQIPELSMQVDACFLFIRVACRGEKHDQITLRALRHVTTTHLSAYAAA